MFDARWPADSIEVEQCPLCGAVRREPYLQCDDALFSCSLWRCSSCGFVYLSPMPPSRLIRTWQDQDRTYDAVDDGLVGERMIVAGIENFARPPGKLLEVGCNQGKLLLAARQSGWEVDGVEISASAFERAHALLGDHVFHGELSDSPFEENAYDVVVLWHVLEHVPHPVEFLETLRRYLRPAGLLALQVPDAGAIEYFRRERRISDLVCPVHLSYFDRQTLRAAVEAAGYGVVSEVEDPALHYLAVFARARPGDEPRKASKAERRKSYGSRTEPRYWWYRSNPVAFASGPLALLSDEEWEVLDSWYRETDALGFAGECGVPVIAMLEALIAGGPIRRVVQLGTFAGFSTLMIGYSMRRMGFRRSVFSIDLSPEMTSFAAKWIATAKLTDIVQLEVGDSADATLPARAASWLGGPPQLVFIDSSHRYDQTLAELDLWYDTVCEGGLILLHDVSEMAQAFDASGAGGVQRALSEWRRTRGVAGTIALNGDFSGGPRERLVYGDACGLGIVQKPFASG